MTAETPATSQLLPVSILAGPSWRALLQEVASHDTKSRFGLLASSTVDSQTALDQFFVEPLATTGGGGYDPGQIKAQISAIAAKALVDHLIIECDPKTHPIALASLFLPDGETDQRFSKVARLNSIALGIDSETLLNSLVHSNHAPGVASPCILADQIECAAVVVLTGDLAERDSRQARAVVSALNPRGRVVKQSRGAIAEQLLNTGSWFDFEAAFAGAGWRMRMDEAPGAHQGTAGVVTFVYRARRPFHPGKFWNLIQSPFAGVFRAKGFFWLATRMSIVGGLNIAGRECHHSPAGKWWAASAGGNACDSVEIPDRFKKEWSEPFGDRRQAIAFMGIDMDCTDLSARLDACLLSDFEMESGAHSWEALPDPFPAWCANTHDHECDDHDCCHH
jgi:G3E family GTPase